MLSTPHWESQFFSFPTTQVTTFPLWFKDRTAQSVQCLTLALTVINHWDSRASAEIHPFSMPEVSCFFTSRDLPSRSALTEVFGGLPTALTTSAYKASLLKPSPVQTGSTWSLTKSSFSLSNSKLQKQDAEETIYPPCRLLLLSSTIKA